MMQPILMGDDPYAKAPRFTAETSATAPRQMLHAGSIGFTHPKTGTK